MSLENVDRFYELLGTDPELRKRALALKTLRKEPEDVLDAFLALAAERGLPFTRQEYMTVMYRRAMRDDGKN